ncbi:hypothetical protein VTJ04DRAFT_6714 [Mycothermus thermophilus]|uniref:uncharacterized protein n=1 Tax=Humicola insolens TaxID=85995 RepID=UPI00374477C7
MPAAVAEVPGVALSFANNFWGKDDAGVAPLLERMHNAKQTCDELRAFYSARASIEDEYARKLLALSRKPLGSQEMGTLKTSLDTVRAEVESMAKQHQNVAAQMKSELEEPLAAFAGAMKERRKIVQNTIEKLLKLKTQQTQHVNKTRDKYEQECLKIKGYLAQGHMVMGQEERKNKAKLEKTQISLATSNTEYENAVKALEETTARWNREWKAAADKFQDLEEERLDFTKSSLWTFANIASTVCVSDDASCEKIRLSLEKMEVEKDIATFIKEKGTGQEIPDPPKYINFCRGDVDSQSEASEDEHYSVAQFPRSINPAFRSSSPQPSTFESHNDPDSALARELAHRSASPAPTHNSSKFPGIPPQQQQQQQQQQQPPQQPPQQHQPPPQQQPPQQQMQLQQHQDNNPPASRRGAPPRGFQQPQRPAPLEYDPSEFAPVPHDPYPMDGMTMLCRPTASDLSTAPSTLSSARPSSRGSHSETSFSSQEPPQTQQQLQQQQQAMTVAAPAPSSPVKQEQSYPPSASSSPDKKTVLKKKSGFFQNHSPFRRKSTKEAVANNRNTWHPSNTSARPQLAAGPSDSSTSVNNNTATTNTGYNSNNNSTAALPYHHNNSSNNQILAPIDRSASPDPIAANASLALNVGGNVFPVDNPDRRQAQQQQQAPEDDPIAMALAELKGVTSGRNNGGGPGPGGRVSADHYHGIATPAPTTAASRSSAAVGNGALTAALRGTPPPSYDTQIQPVAVQRLGVPPPAVTSKAMKESSQKFQQQTRSLFSGDVARPGSGYGAGAGGGVGGGNGNVSPTRPGTSRGMSSEVVPRAVSPAPQRSVSPRPQSRAGRYGGGAGGSPAASQQQLQQRSVSPAPYAGSHRGSVSAASVRGRGSDAYGGSVSRAASPAPYSPSLRGSTGPSSASPFSSSYGAGGGGGGGGGGYGSSTGSYGRSGGGASPSPYSPRGSVNEHARPGSSMGDNSMAMQLAQVGGGHHGGAAGDDGYGSMRGRGHQRSMTATNVGGGGFGSTGSRTGTINQGSMSLYEGAGPVGPARARSKSVAADVRYTRDGRPILHYARALYMYQAAIPEELGFAKGDILCILRHQDDGWWEATIQGGNGMVGLVPSNYLQPL